MQSPWPNRACSRASSRERRNGRSTSGVAGGAPRGTRTKVVDVGACAPARRDLVSCRPARHPRFLARFFAGLRTVISFFGLLLIRIADVGRVLSGQESARSAMVVANSGCPARLSHSYGSFGFVVQLLITIAVADVTPTFGTNGVILETVRGHGRAIPVGVRINEQLAKAWPFDMFRRGDTA